MKLVQQAMKRGYSIFDVQVLAPIYRGPAGIDLLNRELQQAINPRREGKRELTWGDSVFRLGYNRLELSNHPEYPVYNGDIGKVIALDES